MFAVLVVRSTYFPFSLRSRGSIQCMPVPLRRRMSCSLIAAGLAWLISGSVFVVVVRGPAIIWGWLIWGTLFILAGWIIVGLPLVALGDKILRIGRLLVMLIAGIGGALVMELPSFFIMLATTNAGYRWSWSLGDLGLPTIAFAIAAPTGWLYRKLLQEESTRIQVPGRAR